MVLGSLPLVTKMGSGNAVSADTSDALSVEIVYIFLEYAEHERPLMCRCGSAPLPSRCHGRGADRLLLPG